jgi:hypothetical protein
VAAVNSGRVGGDHVGGYGAVRKCQLGKQREGGGEGGAEEVTDVVRLVCVPFFPSPRRLMMV